MADQESPQVTLAHDQRHTLQRRQNRKTDCPPPTLNEAAMTYVPDCKSGIYHWQDRTRLLPWAAELTRQLTALWTTPEPQPVRLTPMVSTHGHALSAYLSSIIDSP